jgi:hypothetical protein
LDAPAAVFPVIGEERIERGVGNLRGEVEGFREKREWRRFLGAAVPEKKEGGLGKKNMIGKPGLAEKEREKKEMAAGDGFPRLLLGCPSRVGPVGLGFSFFFLFFSIFLILLYLLHKDFKFSQTNV